MLYGVGTLLFTYFYPLQKKKKRPANSVRERLHIKVQCCYTLDFTVDFICDLSRGLSGRFFEWEEISEQQCTILYEDYIPC